MPSFKTTLWRGLCLRCPGCGQSGLFGGYITLVPQCGHCGILFRQLRADDGPAWLTIILTGHLLAPLVIVLTNHPDWPMWLPMALLLPFAVLLIFLLLPRSKGLFVAVLWWNRQRAAQE